MVRNENPTEGVQNTDKPQGSQPRPEKQRPDQHRPEFQGRRNNSQTAGQGQNQGNAHVNPQGQRVQNQPRHQGGGLGNASQSQGNRDGHIQNHSQPQNQNKTEQGNQAVSQTMHTQVQPRNTQQNQNQRTQPERHEAVQKEGTQNTQNKGFYRGRDNDRDNQPRQRVVQSSASRYSGPRAKAEETIEDIKEDIIRLEKEIELEMKEIRSLKL